MNCQSEKIVTFLDLLGFSNAVNSDLQGAIRLLEDYSNAVRDALTDSVADGDANRKPNSHKEAHLMEMMLVSSFETLLPMSDSIFIVASDASKFVLQISHFLMNCFNFSAGDFYIPEGGKAPTEARTEPAVSDGASSCKKPWPVLFRGGITFGKCVVVPLPTIKDGEVGDCKSIIGSAVVEAVGLQGRTKGPRILCSLAIRPKISEDAAGYTFIGPPLNDETGCEELYWPMAAFEDTENMADAINNKLRNWFHVIANRYAHFRGDESVRIQYESYIRLLVASALRKYPEGRSELKQMIRDLEPDLLDIAFFHGLPPVPCGAQAARGHSLSNYPAARKTR